MGLAHEESLSIGVDRDEFHAPNEVPADARNGIAAAAAHANHLVDRLLIVRLAVVARGADAFDVADQALVAAHAAMLADPNLGGLAIAVREIDCEWEFDDADAGAVALPARYEIRYRTHAIDLTQTG